MGDSHQNVNAMPGPQLDRPRGFNLTIAEHCPASFPNPSVQRDQRPTFNDDSHLVAGPFAANTGVKAIFMLAA